MKRGRPEFKPSLAQKREVQMMLTCGMTEEDAARAVGISVPTLRKHLGEEIATVRAKGRRRVIAMLVKAADGGNVSAMRRLEELTRLADAWSNVKDAVPKAQQPGKKAAAQADAHTAGAGSEWGDDLKPRRVN